MQVSGVRNLVEQEIPFGGSLNLLAGANGQGKSSVLESIYVLGTTRSFRTSRLSEMVASGGAAARVSASGENPGESLAVLISGKERSYLRFGKAVTPSEYIGAMNVIALSSDLVHRFRTRPSERRRFLDRMAVSAYPGYLDEVRELRRALSQRALLAAAGRGGAERRAWDERAAALAVPVAKRRREMAAAVQAHLREVPGRIFPEGSGASVELICKPRFNPELARGEEHYREELAAIFGSQQSAPGRRETPAGPSRDDLAIEIEGRDLLRFGSSGQIRSLLTATALGEMNRLRARKGTYPALVLDDVDSDLDERRYGALLVALGGGAQVFAATSKGRLAAAAIGEGSRRFTVAAGMVTAA